MGTVRMYLKKMFVLTSLSLALIACGGSSGTTPVPEPDDAIGGDSSTDDIDTADNTGLPDSDIDDSNSVSEPEADTPIVASDAINQLGIIFVEQLPESTFSSQSVFANASFWRLGDQFNGDDLEVDVLFAELADTCVVENLSDDTDDGLSLEDNAESISAGETITLTSSAGTYASLVRTQIDDGAQVYIPESELAAPLPQNLVVDVPGDEFPAFSNITVPNIAPLDITPTVEQTVNADTVFQWNGSNTALGSVDIEATFSVGGEFVDISCVARDDGSFSFPADIRQQIGSDSALSFSYAREAVNVVENGDTQLWVINLLEIPQL